MSGSEEEKDQQSGLLGKFRCGLRMATVLSPENPPARGLSLWTVSVCYCAKHMTVSQVTVWALKCEFRRQMFGFKSCLCPLLAM